MKPATLFLLLFFIHSLAADCKYLSTHSPEKRFFDQMTKEDDVGSGSFGKVYKRKPTFPIGPNKIMFDHEIAFKVVQAKDFSKDDLLQLENEIKANEELSRLDEESGKTVGRTESRFTVRHYECYRFRKTYYFAMEPLTDIVFDLKTEEAIDFGSLVANIEHLIRVTEIIAFLHVNDIIHCDIKGENFMYKSITTNVRAIDFGLVAFAPDYCTGGTPAYLPPEIRVSIHRDIPTWNKAYDIYELGILFGEHFTWGVYNPARMNAVWADDESAEPDVPPVMQAVEMAFEKRIGEAALVNDEIILGWLRNLILKMISIHPFERPDISHVLVNLHLLRKYAKSSSLSDNNESSEILTDDEYFYELEKLKNFQVSQKGIELELLSLWKEERLRI